MILSYGLSAFLSVSLAGPGGFLEHDEELFPESNCDGDPSIEFVSPQDGDDVESPVTVELILRDVCECSTDGCGDVPFMSLSLMANGETTPINGMMATIELPVGEHVLTVVGEAGFTGDTQSITVNVVKNAGGCSLTDSGGPVGVLLGLGVLGVIGLRRRFSADLRS